MTTRYLAVFATPLGASLAIGVTCARNCLVFTAQVFKLAPNRADEKYIF
jgi:hypothetical protein